MMHDDVRLRTGRSEGLTQEMSRVAHRSGVRLPYRAQRVPQVGVWVLRMHDG